MSNPAQQTDLTEAIRWAGQAAICGSDANRTVQAGLRSVIQSTGEVTITNPYSSARDGVTPDLTRVLLCCVQDGKETRHLCIKLYPISASGQAELHAHARLLLGLKEIIPVPDVVKLLPECDAFGFPALVTTACGQPLDTAMRHASVDHQEQMVAQTSEIVSALHSCDSHKLCVDSSYSPDVLRRQWHEDAEWYIAHAPQAGRHAGLVLKGADVLAGCTDVPTVGALLHRDLTPYNILVSGSSVVLVDWDHAGFSAPQEDVGKTLIGLLSMLTIPRGARLQLAWSFLDAYSRARSQPVAEQLMQALPFALDTVLDWLVGGKNASRDELSWATEQLLNNQWL